MPSRKRSQVDSQRLILVGLGLVIAYLLWDKFSTSQRLSNPQYLVELANSLQQESDTGRHAQMILEKRALAKQEFIDLQVQTKKTGEMLQELRTAAAQLEELLEQLRSSSKGAPIASDRDSLEQFHAATDEYAVTSERIAEYQQSLEVLKKPIEATIAQELIEEPPSAELRGKVQAIHDAAIRDAAIVADTDKKVKAILASAPTETSSENPTLADSLTQLEAEWAERDAAAVKQAREAVRAQYREKIAAQQAEQERAESEAELENQRRIGEAQLRAKQEAADREANLIAEAAEAAKQEEQRRIAEREYQEALPEIEKYLSGFITPGHKQLVRDRWVHTEEKKPVSLGALQARHCLRQDDTGYMYFAAHAGSQGNDRPAGALTGYDGVGAPPASLVPDIVKAQNLLIKFSDKLIEHGKLLP
jgi:hypothetical protein